MLDTFQEIPNFHEWCCIIFTISSTYSYLISSIHAIYITLTFEAPKLPPTYQAINQNCPNFQLIAAFTHSNKSQEYFLSIMRLLGAKMSR